MYGVGAPSQPNYVAPGSGDTFGVNNDSFFLVDKNISTVGTCIGYKPSLTHYDTA
jgi:hypothetical protein